MAGSLVNILEETIDYYPILDERSSVNRIPGRHGVEQLALKGAKLDDMVDVDGTTSRGDAFNYLQRIHLVKTEGGLNVIIAVAAKEASKAIRHCIGSGKENANPREIVQKDTRKEKKIPYLKHISVCMM